MDLSSASSSDLIPKIMDSLMRWRKSLRIWHQQQSSFGSSLKSLCSQHLPSSTICSICVNLPGHSKESFRSRSSPSWRLIEFETSSLNFMQLVCGDTNASEYFVINWSTTRTRILLLMLLTIFLLIALEWKQKSMKSLQGINSLPLLIS